MNVKLLISLQTYSGYYKHEIETNLIGAEQMFEEMGYKHVDFGVLVLEGPVDPDKVTSVSRDALIAFVECQVSHSIYLLSFFVSHKKKQLIVNMIF